MAYDKTRPSADAGHGAAVLRWAGRAALAAGVVIVLVVACAGGTLVWLTHSPQRLGPVLEVGLEYWLKRELSIGVVVEAQLGSDTYLVARNVRLANPGGMADGDFVSAEALSIRLNIPSLWQDGPVWIPEVQLDRVSLNLIDDGTGLPTWSFWPGEPAGSRSEFPVLIERGTLNSAVINFRDADQSISAKLDSASLDKLPGRRRSKIELGGEVNAIPLSLSGEIGPLLAFLEPEPLAVDLALNWGQLRVIARGSVADLERRNGVDLAITATAPQARPLLDALGMPEVRDGPLKIEGRLTDAQPGVGLDFHASLADFNMQAAGVVAAPLTLDGVDVEIELQGPSLAEAGAMLNVENLPELPFAIVADVHRLGPQLTVRQGRIDAGEGSLRIQGQLPNFPRIDDWEASVNGTDLDLAVWRSLLGAKGLPSVPYALQGVLQSTDQGVELVNLHVLGEDTQLLINGVMGEAPDYVGTRVTAELSGDNMQAIGGWLGAEKLPAQPFDGAGQFTLLKDRWQLSDVNLRTEGLLVKASGQRLSAGQLSGEIRIAIPNIASTSQRFDLQVGALPALPLSLTAALEGTTQAMSLESGSMALGQTTATLHGELGSLPDFDGFSLAVAFDSPDLMALLGSSRGANATPLPVRMQGELQAGDDGVIVRNYRGVVAGASVDLGGFLSYKAGLDGSQVSVTAAAVNLADVLAPWTELPLQSAPARVALKAVLRGGELHLNNIQGDWEGHALEGTVVARETPGGRVWDSQLTLHGPSSKDLARLLGKELRTPDAPYQLSSTMKVDKAQWQLDPFTLRWGKSDYRGLITYVPGSIPKVRVDLHSDYVSLLFLLPDPDELAASRGKKQPPQGTATAADTAAELTRPLTQAERAQRLISDKALDVGWLRDLDATVKWVVDELHVNPEATASAVVDLVIADNVLTARELKWDGTLVAGDAKLRLHAAERTNEIEAEFDLRRIPLFVMLGGESLDESDSVYRARFSARGRSPRELAASLSGAALIRGGGGRLDNSGLDLVLGDVLNEIVTRLNPNVESEAATIFICHAGGIIARDGVVRLEPGLVARTDKLDVVVGGQVDLNKEALSVEFNTRSRKGIGISASKAITPYLKLGGTLANPRLALDMKGAAVSGGAAIATGGLSIVLGGMWDRWIATASNPCEAMYDRVVESKRREFTPLLYRR